MNESRDDFVQEVSLASLHSITLLLCKDGAMLSYFSHF